MGKVFPRKALAPKFRQAIYQITWYDDILRLSQNVSKKEFAQIPLGMRYNSNYKIENLKVMSINAVLGQ